MGARSLPELARNGGVEVFEDLELDRGLVMIVLSLILGGGSRSSIVKVSLNGLTDLAEFMLDAVCNPSPSLKALVFLFSPRCELLPWSSVQSITLSWPLSASTTLISIPRPEDSSSSVLIVEPLCDTVLTSS